ncbi:MAG: LCP family protein [Acidimicrobiales bacterium]
MASSSPARLRRTWPQRLLILFNLGVIAACLTAAVLVRDAEEKVQRIPRVSFDSDVLIPSVEPGEPLTFLLVGADSAAGLDDDDPRREGRNIDQEEADQIRADSIVLVRVDPETGQAATVSIPRDLWVDVPGSGREWKINSALAIGGQEKLVETVSENFGVEINHYVQVDFAGFADVIDVMGGVHVWFENPAMDRKAGLDIPEAGCHRLDGDQSLAYVRGREFQEFIDDRWRITGGSDLTRIERQQDFLIVALDQALAAGGRNPVEIRRLVEAGVQTVTLDDRLSPNDLIELANAMGDFEPDRLRQYSLPVFDDRVDGLKVLRLRSDEADAVFDVFRGEAGFLSPSDISVVIGGSDSNGAADARSALGLKEFVVEPTLELDDEVTTIRFSEDQADQAELIGRFLDPVPAFELVAGTEQLSLSVSGDYGTVRLIARAEGEVEPDVEAALDEDPVAAPTTSGEVGSVDTTVAPPTTEEPPSFDTVPTTTTEVITGRAPEGESCP